MIGMKLDVQRSFFTSRDVIRATDAAERRNLSRFGAFVRSDARRSIRKRKKVSQPGRPPTNRSGKLKRFIYFAYDRSNSSVVVGPVRLSGLPGDAPNALEHGGTATRTTTRSRARKRRRKTIRVAARPFMQPAFDKNESKIADIWRDSIR